MYLIYRTTDGSIFREVGNYRNGVNQIEAGINGTYTLIYPDAVSPAVLEITQEQLAALGNDYSKWLVQDGAIVENPNWTPRNEKLEEALRLGYITQEQYDALNG